MKNKNAHNATQIFRQVLASALLLVVLLSSCSTKRGVKVLFDMPVKMEHVGTFGHYISSVDHSATECVKCADLQVITADAYDHSLLKNLSSAIFISVVFSLLLLPFFRPEEEHNYKLTKRVQKYVEGEFSDQLKKLTHTEGQILVKLIDRQTGITAFELVKELRTGWRAFWYNTTANLFEISLKEEYRPFEVKEDYLIEDILERSFQEGRLERQEPASPINYLDLKASWNRKTVNN